LPHQSRQKHLSCWSLARPPEMRIGSATPSHPQRHSVARATSNTEADIRSYIKAVPQPVTGCRNSVLQSTPAEKALANIVRSNKALCGWRRTKVRCTRHECCTCNSRVVR
jgi:hypothetical protein